MGTDGESEMIQTGWLTAKHDKDVIIQVGNLRGDGKLQRQEAHDVSTEEYPAPTPQTTIAGKGTQPRTLATRTGAQLWPLPVHHNVLSLESCPGRSADATSRIQEPRWTAHYSTLPAVSCTLTFFSGQPRGKRQGTTPTHIAAIRSRTPRTSLDGSATALPGSST